MAEPKQDTTLTIRLPAKQKERFESALSVGRRASASDVLRELMDAYCERTETDSRQPEFPLEVHAKRLPADPEKK